MHIKSHIRVCNVPVDQTHLQSHTVDLCNHLGNDTQLTNYWKVPYMFLHSDRVVYTLCFIQEEMYYATVSWFLVPIDIYALHSTTSFGACHILMCVMHESTVIYFVHMIECRVQMSIGTRNHETTVVIYFQLCETKYKSMKGIMFSMHMRVPMCWQ